MAPSPSPAPNCPAHSWGCQHKDQVVAVRGLCTGKDKERPPTGLLLDRGP